VVDARNRELSKQPRQSLPLNRVQSAGNRLRSVRTRTPLGGLGRPARDPAETVHAARCVRQILADRGVDRGG
jgi:hypothetical protein